jgi:hypothetical protein
MLDLNLLYCPYCKKELHKINNSLICHKCNRIYEVKNDIPVFVKQASYNIDEKTSAEYWDKLWSQKNIYKHLYASRKKIEFYLKITGMFNKTVTEVKKNKNKRILALEVGCGGSQFMNYFLNKIKNLELWGFDRSLEGCLLAKDKKTNIVCADIFLNPFKQKSFDFVFDFTVIHHFKKPEKILEIYSTLLKPNGILTCVVPNLHGLLGNAINSIGVDTMKKISIDELHKWIEKLGFKKITVKPVGGLHPLLMIAQSYRSESQPIKEDALLFFYNFILGLPLLILNFPFLFRLNSKKLSPFLIVEAVK